MPLPDYGALLAIARRNAWDPDGVDLDEDAVAWQRLGPAARTPIAALLGGFLIGERAVATDIRPFARQASSARIAACFEAQAADEDRHRRFFERVHAELLGESPDTAVVSARQRVPQRFVDLFERELRDMASLLAHRAEAFVEAVALYHGIIEGVVFLAGQAELLARLQEQQILAGVTAGVSRVQRDERWHVTLGAKLLSEHSPERLDRGTMLHAGRRALNAWGPVVRHEIADSTLSALERRLRICRPPTVA